MLLSAEQISKNYGTKQLLKDASLFLKERERIGILGINGTGKSTLLKILAGLETAEEGTIACNPNLKILYLPQNPIMEEEFSVIEQVFESASMEFRESNAYMAKSILNKLGVTDFDAKIKTLSGGQRKRVALAAVLVQPADILILDEPTNHLDSEMVCWLEQYLTRFSGGLIMVTHDRYFLERVANRIVELSQSSLYSYEANYSKYLEIKAERGEMNEASERKRQSILRKEYQWIMRGARARSTKSRGRIERYEELRDKEAPVKAENIQMATMTSRLGRKIIELNEVSKSYGGHKIIDCFSYSILRDDRIGIIGRNGAGKSTLLDMITGEAALDSGTMEIGSTVKIGYFKQECRELDTNQRVYDFISDIGNEIKTKEGTFSASQMLERFLFSADLQYTTIGRLSGGERRRLYLLSILMEAPNVLLLDEPTNDLDIETLTILEDYLEDFPGAVIAVSHDRYFLDKVASTIFEVTDSGNIKYYMGNYSDYSEKRAEESEEETVKISQTKSTDSSANTISFKTGNEERPKKLKFSYHEQREFEQIDDDIAVLEDQIAACTAEMEEAASDYIRLQSVVEKQEKLKNELEEKTERWVYLNELAEKIASQKEGNYGESRAGE